MLMVTSESGIQMSKQGKYRHDQPSILTFNSPLQAKADRRSQRSVQYNYPKFYPVYLTERELDALFGLARAANERPFVGMY